jgi:murein DD-endopeptidase MepM/ murein hydrolase activator NlpD
MNQEEQINAKSLKEKHRAMESLPHISTTTLTGNFSGKPIGQEKVPIERIVATPKLENWADEYHKAWKKGELTSVENLSVRINKEGDKFWEKTQQPVKLTKISGPKGPIYAVEDGSHRVAAAKLAGVSEIPAEVEDLTDRREFMTSDEVEKSWWEALIYRGAIKGKIEKRGPNYHLALEETPELPWILQGRSRFVNANRVYQRVYGEEALAEVKSVPQEILYNRGKTEVWGNMAIREKREKEAAEAGYKPKEEPEKAPPAVKPEKEIKEAVSAPAKIYQAVPRVPGVGTIRRAVYQKAIRPIVTRFLGSRLWKRLAKTAVAKAIKTGIKVAAKQGIKAGVQAAITAAGISAAGVGVIVSIVVNAAIEVASWIAEKVINRIIVKIKKALRKPEVAIVLAGLGAASIFIIGAPVGIIIGVPLILLGGLGFVTGGALTVAGTTLGTFLGIVLAAPMGQVTLAISLLVIGTTVGLMVLTFFIVITTAGAFIIPERPYPIYPYPEASPYFNVTKIVSRKKIPNSDLPGKPCVTYRVEVTAEQPIEITTIVDERTINCGPSNTHNPQVVSPVDVPPPSGLTTSWTSQAYELCFDETFVDCRVCNTVTVTATIGGETGERDSDTQCVDIGTPPEDCPSGWPTPNGFISQGPNTPQGKEGDCTSHYGQEAIDIGGVGIGTDVYATHRGTARWGNSEYGGLYVAISGICDGKSFTSYYYHLSSINFGVMGAEVAPGTKIGETGNTGEYSEGAHLHYEFVGLEMKKDYVPNRCCIPEAVPQGCCEICGSCHDVPCGVSW